LLPSPYLGQDRATTDAQPLFYAGSLARTPDLLCSKCGGFDVGLQREQGRPAWLFGPSNPSAARLATILRRQWFNEGAILAVVCVAFSVANRSHP